MAEVSGNPIVNRSDCVAASYLKAQDNLTNPTSGGTVSLNNIGTLGWLGTMNNVAVTSGRSLTATNSGAFAPLGFVQIQVSGQNVVVPFFAP